MLAVFYFPCAQPLALTRRSSSVLFLLGLVLMGFLGQPEKFAGCGPLQFAHFAGAFADLVHSEVRWPPEHLKHFGDLAQNRE
ncbi:hypothetical protein TNCV_4561691 [Trichonephila clavipes]|nr:hypothetical protein TNCV_4561691 [Trichonephila clavipes]